MSNEVLIARRELGNAIRLLNELTDKLVLVACLLNKAAGEPPEGTLET